MAAFNFLRSARSSIGWQSLKDCPSFNQKIRQIFGQQFIRNMGHERKMDVLPSQYEWRKFKDILHFYTVFNMIPAGLLIIYLNLTRGRAELADTPEGYVPKHYEYFKYPISRLIARYLHDDEVGIYERNLHVLNDHNEKRKMRKLEKKVKQLMSDRDDYQAWYYIPVSDRQAIVGYYEREKEVENQGVMK